MYTCHIHEGPGRDQETIVQKERSDVHMSYMKDQVDKETIDQKERSDVHMSYMKDQVEQETIVDI